MRGCQSAGILQRISLTETLAETEDDYVNIAVNLGLNTEIRDKLRDKIKRQKIAFYNDKSCVDVLEEFYCNVVENKNK